MEKQSDPRRQKDPSISEIAATDPPRPRNQKRGREGRYLGHTFVSTLNEIFLFH